jgi:hypothetical protein
MSRHLKDDRRPRVFKCTFDYSFERARGVRTISRILLAKRSHYPKSRSGFLDPIHFDDFAPALEMGVL